MRTRRLIQFVVTATVLLLVVSWGVSGALEYGWARRSLLARLSASFGRPVDARSFSFSLLSGLRLEVNSITVGEDPRFGQEYFLHADQLTVGLSWMALLRGRVEFGTLSLSHPSLNLVHMPDGHWNVESWLPPANDQSAASALVNDQTSSNANRDAPVPAAGHLGRIEIDGGRINFKLNQKKLLFALEDVSGHLDQDATGRWSLDLQAVPILASLSLQEVGTLRLSGTVAGTSARLRPASLNLTWEDASLADALRLATGQDYTVRGQLGAEFSATIKDKPDNKPDNSSAAGQWNIAGTLRLSGIHRWDLAARPANPAVNVSVAADWSPGTPRLGVTRLVVESAHSQLIAAGDMDWTRDFNPSMQITSSSIDLEDLLAWRRSFRPDLPDDITADGVLGLQAALAAWPPRIQQASISSTGANIHLPALAEPIRVGPISAVFRKDSLVLDSVAVSLPGAPVVLARGRPSGTAVETVASVGTVRVEGSLGPLQFGISSRKNNPPRTGSSGINPLDWQYRVSVSGQTGRAQDLALIAEALGHAFNAGGADWTVQGPAAMQLAWAGTLRHPSAPPTGTLDLSGLQLTTALLNQPVLLSSASVELAPGARRVKLGDVQAFGTHWKGTLDQEAAHGVWHFDLSAGRLDITDLDRWLGPRARPSFLQRMLPFASSGPPPTRDAAFRGLVINGRLRIAELAFAPLLVQKLDAAAEFDGHSFVLRRAQADLFDGRIIGDFEAQISASPTYSFHGQFERVNLAALSSAPGSPESRFAGIAAGNITLAARGIGRDQLFASLAGAGKLQVRDAILRGVDLLSSVTAATDPKAGPETRFNTAAANLRFGNGVVQVDDLSLATREERFEVQGAINLNRKLALRVWSMPRGATNFVDANSGSDHEGWIIGGTLDAPQFVRQSHMGADPESVARVQPDVVANPASNASVNPALGSNRR